MKMRTIKTVANDKPHDHRLTSHIVFSKIMPKISKDETLSGHFTTTAEKIEDIKNMHAGSCKSCHFKSNDIAISFIGELKKCPAEKQAVIATFVGDKQWFFHSETKNWINIVSNTIEKVIYEDKQVPIVAPNKASEPEVIKEKPKLPEPPQKPAEPPQPKPNVVEHPKPEPVAPVAPEPMKVPVENIKQNQIVPVAEDNMRNVTETYPKKYIFRNFQAPGDIVMMSAAIRDLHRCHPNKFITDVRTNSMPIWESNKYITKLNEKDPDVQVVDLEYDLIHQSNQGPYHFSEGFTEHIEKVLGVRISRRIGYGHIEIGSQEEGWGKMERESWFGEHGYSPETQFWIVNAGFKNDFTCKMWPAERYQQVIDHFKDRILFVQIGHSSHNHPNLKNVINLVGKTDDRQLIRLVWASSGVLTPCSYPMTLAAAVPVRPGSCHGRSNRPCVVVAGGREPSGWQLHTGHQFIDTCGMLPCCQNGGCWASRIKPIGDGDDKDRRNMCKHVVTSEEGVDLPFCMDMITADEVVRRIEMYHTFYTPGRKKTFSHNTR